MRLNAAIACLGALACGVAQAWPKDDAPIYQLVFAAMAARDKAPAYLISTSAIPAQVFAAARVPRQIPEFQFSRSVKGVGTSLELALVYANLPTRGLDGTVEPLSLAEFPLPPGFASQVRFVRREDVPSQAPAGQASTVIGFSRIAYGERSAEALLYAESCGTSAEGICTGVAHFFRKDTAGVWKSAAKVDLWQGHALAFWTDQMHLLKDTRGR